MQGNRRAHFRAPADIHHRRAHVLKESEQAPEGHMSADGQEDPRQDDGQVLKGDAPEASSEVEEALAEESKVETESSE